MNINQVAYLQAEIAHAYMRRHHLSPDDFIALDKKYNILNYIALGYEPFHLTGTQGVIDEIDDYISAVDGQEKTFIPYIP